MTDIKLDASLKDIIFEQDFTGELKKELEKINYAQAFMWLGIKFLNNNAESVTAIDLSKEVWGGKDASYCLRILNRFEMLHILKSVKKDGGKVRSFQLNCRKELFLDFKDMAMRTIREAKNKGAE